MPKYHLTSNARRYRRLMWLTALAALPALALVIQGLRGETSLVVGILAVLVFLTAISVAAVLGLKMHRQTLIDRDMQARRAMIVMMAETLGKESDESLEHIRERGGMSGEAADLILKARQAKDAE
jgi:hypothetical protein